MERRILNHFKLEEQKQITDEADVVLKQLAQTELKVGEDGTTAVYAGVLFSQLTMLLYLGKPERVTAFFDDLENSFNNIAGVHFEWNGSFESRPDVDACEGGLFRLQTTGGIKLKKKAEIVNASRLIDKPITGIRLNPNLINFLRAILIGNILIFVLLCLIILKLYGVN